MLLQRLPYELVGVAAQYLDNVERACLIFTSKALYRNLFDDSSSTASRLAFAHHEFDFTDLTREEAVALAKRQCVVRMRVPLCLGTSVARSLVAAPRCVTLHLVTMFQKNASPCRGATRHLRRLLRSAQGRLAALTVEIRHQMAEESYKLVRVLDMEVADLFDPKLKRQARLRHLALELPPLRVRMPPPADSSTLGIPAFPSFGLRSALMTDRPLTGLERLSYTDSCLGMIECRALAFIVARGNLPDLRVLDLGRNVMTDEAWAVLANALNSRPPEQRGRLRRLDVSDNCLGSESFRKLALLVSRHPGLRSLDVSSNLGDDGIHLLIHAVSVHPALEKLNMSSNHAFGIAITRTAQTGAEQLVARAGCSIADRVSLTELARSQTLRELDLSNTLLCDEHATSIYTLLTASRSLRSINLENNHFGDSGAAVVLSAVPSWARRVGDKERVSISLRGDRCGTRCTNVLGTLFDDTRNACVRVGPAWME